MTPTVEREPTHPKRIFVVGCRRSGTTWVTMLLAQDPRVVGVQQSSFFYRLEYLSRFVDESVPYGRHVLTAAENGSSKAGLERRAVRNLIPLDRIDAHVRPLAVEVYDRLCDCAPGARAVVDHQPENIRSSELILRIFPDAYFIHVVRDPRSVFSSYVQSSRTWAEPGNFTTSPREFAAEWEADVRTGQAIGRATERYLEVRYEDLRNDTEGQLALMQESFDLTTDSARRRASVEACRIDRVRESNHGPRGYFRSGETEGWRKDLSRSKAAIVEHLCGDLMDELGYQRAHRVTDRGPLALRAHDLGGWLRQRARGLIRRG